LDTDYNIEALISGVLECDILILEGAFREEGLMKGGREVSQLIKNYATKAKHIITAGTCATFGGVFKEYDPDNITGFCFDKDIPTVRYENYASKLISLPGCPIHPKWLSFVLMMLAKDRSIAIDEFHRPQELYAVTVHNGCPRNEYFEWKIDSKGFGVKEGCLFYEQGCQAPYTRGSCNKILWNDISSKTVIGTPCFGCTEPTFPKQALFSTKTNMGIPATMPLGVPRRAYLTATGIAKSFKIKRLEERIIKYDS
jgi:hydrogenase small subunit